MQRGRCLHWHPLPDSSGQGDSGLYPLTIGSWFLRFTRSILELFPGFPTPSAAQFGKQGVFTALPTALVLSLGAGEGAPQPLLSPPEDWAVGGGRVAFGGRGTQCCQQEGGMLGSGWDIQCVQFLRGNFCLSQSGSPHSHTERNFMSPNAVQPFVTPLFWLCPPRAEKRIALCPHRCPLSLGGGRGSNRGRALGELDPSSQTSPQKHAL